MKGRISSGRIKKVIIDHSDDFKSSSKSDSSRNAQRRRASDSKSSSKEGGKPEPTLSRRARAHINNPNKTIDFQREGKKGNSRKTETPVICSGCGCKFVLPFKPRFPQVYCNDCFKEIKNSRK